MAINCLLFNFIFQNFNVLLIKFACEKAVYVV